MFAENKTRKLELSAGRKQQLYEAFKSQGEEVTAVIGALEFDFNDIEASPGVWAKALLKALQVLHLEYLATISDDHLRAHFSNPDTFSSKDKSESVYQVGASFNTSLTAAAAGALACLDDSFTCNDAPIAPPNCGSGCMLEVAAVEVTESSSYWWRVAA